MLGRKGGRAARKSACVWLLGRDHPHADRSLKWDGSFGNLRDPDALIVDLTWLTKDILQRIDKDNLDQAQVSIRDKILYGGTLVVITQPEFSIRPNSPPTGLPADAYGRAAAAGSYTYSNHHILPINIAATAAQANPVIRAGDGHLFKGHNFVINSVTNKIPPDPTGTPPAALRPLLEWDITDNSRCALGLVLVVGPDHYGRLQQAPGPGYLVILPPPTGPFGEPIGRILSVYKAPASAGAPPTWAERLSPGPASENKARIAELEARKAEIQGEIDGLARRNDRVLAYRRLLYSDGPDLEDAVVEAFRALGFNDIERMGKADEEDATFGMDGTRYSRSVVEVKWTYWGIQVLHILQCHGWAARQAAADGRPSKGILVPNQHRLRPYPESSKIRMKIESNQAKQAEVNNVCIIHSCELFKAVSRALGGEEPDRARIARKIADSKGVLKDVF